MVVIIMSCSDKRVSLCCPNMFLAMEAKLGLIICIYKECEGDDDDDDDDASKIAPAAWCCSNILGKERHMVKCQYTCWDKCYYKSHICGIRFWIKNWGGEGREQHCKRAIY